MNQPKNEVARTSIDNYSDITTNNNANNTNNIGEANSDDNNGSSNDQTIDYGFKISDMQKNIFEGSLANILLLNNNNQVPAYGAKVRKDSVYNVYLEDLEIHYLSFIVDLDELKQSYQFVYRYADKYPNPNVPPNYATMVFCPRTDKLIYGDFDCKDEYNNYGEDAVIASLLKNKKFSNLFLNVHGAEDFKTPLEKLVIRPMFSSDNKERDSKNIINDWLANVGLNIDNYQCEFMTQSSHSHH